MMVEGWFNPSKRSEQTRAIRSVARAHHARSTCLDHPAPLDAIAHAMELRSKGPVLMVGPISEWVPPPDDHPIDVVSWREGLIRMLESSEIGVEFIDIEDVSLATRRSANDADVIRRFLRALGRIEQELASRKRGVSFHGRPPYGYRVSGGRVIIDPYAAEAVTLIFQNTRKGTAPKDTLAELKRRFPRTPDGKKTQFWDHAKIRRILDHAPLYCRGLRNGTARSPALAFLPSEWVDTPLTSSTAKERT